MGERCQYYVAREKKILCDMKPKEKKPPGNHNYCQATIVERGMKSVAKAKMVAKMNIPRNMPR